MGVYPVPSRLTTLASSDHEWCGRGQPCRLAFLGSGYKTFGHTTACLPPTCPTCPRPWVPCGSASEATTTCGIVLALRSRPARRIFLNRWKPLFWLNEGLDLGRMKSSLHCYEIVAILGFLYCVTGVRSLRGGTKNSIIRKT